MLASLILAQAQPNGGGAPPVGGGGPPVALLTIILLFVCGFYLVWLIVGIFFLLTLQKALNRCHPENRTTQPGLVWLNLIPVFNFVWIFLTIIWVAESLENEFRARRWHRRGDDYGRNIGLTTAGLNLAGFIPYCGLLFRIAWLVCWIIYWVKIAGYSGQLAVGSPRRPRYDDDYDDEYDDDYDDRRRRRRNRDDDRDDDDREDDRKPWERGRQ